MLPYASTMLAQLMMSGLHLTNKIVLNAGIPPFLIPFIRTVGTLPLLRFAVFLSKDESVFLFNFQNDFMIFFVLGLMGVVLNTQSFSWGAQYTSASDCGLIQPTIVILTSVLAISMGVESFSWGKMLAILLAVGGSFVIVLGGSPDEDDSQVSEYRAFGLILLLFSASVYCLFVVWQRPLFQKYQPLTLLYLCYATSSWLNILIGFFFITSDLVTSVTVEVFLCCLYLIVFGTFGSYSLSAYSNKHLPSSIVTMGVCFAPFFTSILGAVFLNEVITGWDVVGAIILIVAVFLIVYLRVKEINALGHEPSQDYSAIYRVYAFLRHPFGMKPLRANDVYGVSLDVSRATNETTTEKHFPCIRPLSIEEVMGTVIMDQNGNIAIEPC